jgi:hypothetical protein
MFRVLVLSLALFGVRAFAANGPIVNCALLSNEQIIESTKILPAVELHEMAVRCADQRDMFVIVADQQTDVFERRRFMRYANRAGIASEQFLEAYRMAVALR